jgi:hypothetical protein
MNRLITTTMLAAAITTIASPLAQAQLSSCNTSIDATTLGAGPFDIGAPVSLRLTLSAGDIFGGNYLDISEFSVFLDCTAGDTWPSCTVAGNTVTFDENSVTTTCTDGAEPTPLPSTFTTTESGVQVTFTPDPDPTGVVRLPANSSCTVDFDVTVDAIADTNTDREIVELLGWAEADGACDNGDNGGNATSIAFDISTDITYFNVTKTFSDGSPGEVDVQLVCNAGNNLVQNFTLSDGGKVQFQIAGFEPGNMDCDISEVPVDGYEPDYTAGTVDGVAADIYDDDDGCHFDGVEGGSFLCDISNDLEPVPLIIRKDFLFEDGDPTDQWAEIEVICQNYRLGPDGPIIREGSQFFTADGDTARVFPIYPNWDEPVTRCRALENITTTGVDSDQGCADWIELTVAGDGGDCTITNTIFYEGIPALDPRGLAMLALLMLGLGGFALRRLA